MATDELVRALLVVVAVVLLAPLLMMVLAWPMMGLWGGGHMWTGRGATWVWLSMWLVLLLILAGGGYLLYRAIGGRRGEETDAAIEELRLAYARGELSDEEFEERRQRLRRQQ